MISGISGTPTKNSMKIFMLFLVGVPEIRTVPLVDKKKKISKNYLLFLIKMI